MYSKGAVRDLITRINEEVKDGAVLRFYSMNESDANILLTVMQYTIQVLVMYWFVCKMVGIYKGADSFVKWLKNEF